MTAQLVTRLTPALWQARAALDSDPPSPVEVREALHAVQQVHDEMLALTQRRRLEDHDYAWSLEATGPWIERLRGLVSSLD